MLEDGKTMALFAGYEAHFCNAVLLDRLPGALHKVSSIAGVGSEIRVIIGKILITINMSCTVFIEVDHKGSCHHGSALAFFSIDANELIALQFFSFGLFRRCRGGCGGRCGLGLTTGS